MIKFFRKIRFDLMENNKTAKYLAYAIGEIVLVVLGILIALQLNNHNEILKSKKFEQEIIFLINQNLEQDSIALSARLFEAKLANHYTDSLLAQVANKNYADNLNEWMGKIICFERFQSQSSAFEVLKAKGIENVTDNQLQLELISYYDEYLFSLYKSLEDVEYSFKTDWIPVLKTQFLDFKWRGYSVPIDSKSFFEDKSNIVLFKLFRDNRDGEIEQMEANLKKIAEIRKQIK
ncbi:MAG: DUF6090 family protein, partial [Muriicola sp.]